jgi:hypothetical protein
MLEAWHDFYLLIGGSAGALIGLLFVVASLTGGLNENTEHGRRLYLSPVVFHFCVVLGVGGLAMAAHVPPAAAALLVGAAGLTGLCYMTAVAREMFAGKTTNVPHWTDPWWYGVVPAAIYAAMLLAAGLMPRWPEQGPMLLAATQIALVAVSVRNAWDLITWIAPRAHKDPSAQSAVPPDV